MLLIKMFFILDIFFLTENPQRNLLQAKCATMYMKIINFIRLYSFHDVLLISKTVYFTQTVILLLVV
jgi:hypothetical protein